MHAKNGNLWIAYLKDLDNFKYIRVDMTQTYHYDHYDSI